jgi:hypothetical protein
MPNINQLKERKGLFGLTVLEVSVDGQLAPQFWGCDEAAHHCGSMWLRKLLTSWPEQERDREPTTDQHPRIPFKVMSSNDLKLPIRPHLLRVLPPLNSSKLGSREQDFSTVAYGGQSRSKL